MLWVCVCDRHASGATLSVRHAVVQDCHSVLHAFTLNRIIDVLPVVRRTTMLTDSMELVVVLASADDVMIAVSHAQDLPPATVSLVSSIRSTMTLRMDMKICGYAAAMLAHIQRILCMISLNGNW